MVCKTSRKNQRHPFYVLSSFHYFIFIMYYTEIAPSSTSYYTHHSRLQEKRPNPHLPPQCRICLQQMLNQPELDYCLCKGNLKYVHQQCLIQWTSHTKIFEEGRTKYCFCEICKGRILLHTYNKMSFLNGAQICSSIFCNPVISQRIKRIILVLSLILLLASEIIQVIIYLSDSEKRGTRVLIALMVFNSMFLLLVTLYFLFKYVLTKTTRVVGIKGVAFNWKSLENMKSQQIF